VIRGPMRGAEHAFVAVSDWLGDAPEPLDRSDALARLARRYLAGHGPADAPDLARWAGITLGDARIAFGGVADEVIERPDGLIDLVDRATPAKLPKPRLLGPFDPLLLGWGSREPFVGTHQGVVTNNGLFRACALVKGRVVATWGLSGTTLTLKPLEPVSAAVVKALRADAADVVRFLGLADETKVVVAQA
jgi:Winged helix DNA-binding domain